MSLFIMQLFGSMSWNGMLPHKCIVNNDVILPNGLT